ncbi:MAG: Holliday junction branch migration protein RuvA [Bacilli bacterium]|jgi:Holliday junction DNA helicase RuvA|nr:Holliday junction branch migration protein RuvA [Bacilli bacterium]
MFSFIKGKIKETEKNYVTIENNGIGFQIFVANPFSYPIESEQTIYIYPHIREDEFSLYGFNSMEEKELFLRLINVKGLGPKMALPMFALGSVSGIIDAIDRENTLYLTKFPKIGDKIARQIILDLKGKLSTSNTVSPQDLSELVEVLESLGYKNSDIKKILPKIPKDLKVEEQVKEALKLLLK